MQAVPSPPTKPWICGQATSAILARQSQVRIHSSPAFHIHHLIPFVDISAQLRLLQQAPSSLAGPSRPTSEGSTRPYTSDLYTLDNGRRVSRDRLMLVDIERLVRMPVKAVRSIPVARSQRAVPEPRPKSTRKRKSNVRLRDYDLGQK